MTSRRRIFTQCMQDCKSIPNSLVFICVNSICRLNWLRSIAWKAREAQAFHRSCSGGFGKTRGWVNHDTISILGWTILLKNSVEGKVWTNAADVQHTSHGSSWATEGGGRPTWGHTSRTDGFHWGTSNRCLSRLEHVVDSEGSVPDWVESFWPIPPILLHIISGTVVIKSLTDGSSLLLHLLRGPRHTWWHHIGENVTVVGVTHHRNEQIFAVTHCCWCLSCWSKWVNLRITESYPGAAMLHVPL